MHMRQGGHGAVVSELVRVVVEPRRSGWTEMRPKRGLGGKVVRVHVPPREGHASNRPGKPERRRRHAERGERGEHGCGAASCRSARSGL